MLNLFEKNLWLTLALACATVIVAISAISLIAGRHPPLSSLVAHSGQPLPSMVRRDVEAMFANNLPRSLASPTNTVNPFFTLHFQPPPPPPPPATKKVELLYIGSMETSFGLKMAQVRYGDALMILTNGAKVVADHAVKEIQIRRLTLTNAAGLTNVLEFNVKGTVEIPAN